MKRRDLVLIAGAIMILTAIVLMLVSVVSHSTVSPPFVSLTMIGGIVLIILYQSNIMDEN